MREWKILKRVQRRYGLCLIIKFHVCVFKGIANDRILVYNKYNKSRGTEIKSDEGKVGLWNTVRTILFIGMTVLSGAC